MNKVMDKPMLLIVDDEKPTREGLRSALEDRYDVYVAEDAATAMQLLEQEHFDVLLTDGRTMSTRQAARLALIELRGAYAAR